MGKQIIICADDFAQNEAISDGILMLASMRRINAISCLVNTPYWNDLQSGLATELQKCYIGLHLNFTHGQPLSATWRKCEGESFYGLGKLIRRLYLKKIKMETIIAEIQAQIDVFSHTMHIYPDFVDGHQHIQQLPLIRKALFQVHANKMGHVRMASSDENTEEDQSYSESFFRNTSNGFKDMFSVQSFPKRQIISTLGGRKFKRLLTKEQIPTNTSFAGIYNFNKAKKYRHYFQSFLNKTKDGGIIMCHPGSYSEDLSDPLYKSRHIELDYFKSDLFLTDIEENNFLLASK